MLDGEAAIFHHAIGGLGNGKGFEVDIDLKSAENGVGVVQHVLTEVF